MMYLVIVPHATQSEFGEHASHDTQAMTRKHSFRRLIADAGAPAPQVSFPLVRGLERARAAIEADRFSPIPLLARVRRYFSTESIRTDLVGGIDRCAASDEARDAALMLIASAAGLASPTSESLGAWARLTSAARVRATLRSAERRAAEFAAQRGAA